MYLRLRIISANKICDSAWVNSAYVHTKFDHIYFNNFLSKLSVSMKFLLIVQLTIGNPIQFTELV